MSTGTPRAPGGLQSISWRSAILRAATGVALFVGLGYLAVTLVPGSGDRLASADPAWMAACVVLELVACAGFATCFWASFSYHPHHVTRARSGQIALGELAAFAIVPTGLAAPLLRFWALRRGGMPFRAIGARSVVHAVLLNVPYVLVALLLGIGVIVGAGPGRAPLAVALAPVGVVVVSLLAAAGFTWFGRRATRGASELVGWRRMAREVALVVPTGLRQIPARARRPGAIGGAAIWWGCDCAVLWAAFQAVGESPHVAVLALAYMLGQLGTTLPLPGGVGGVEPIMLAVLVASGVGAAAGAAAIVVYRAVSLGIQSAVGALAVSLLIPAVRAETRETG
jgi:uncharacterized membrane protein YbhN (UPF0104 family)